MASTDGTASQADESITEALALIAEGMDRLEHARRILAHQLQAADSGQEVTSPKEDLLRESAYLHWKFLHEHGSLTVGDSREIRRDLYPDKATMRATANQFGKGADSGANFYRDVPYGTPLNKNQLVHLTDVGRARAQAHAAAHELPWV